MNGAKNPETENQNEQLNTEVGGGTPPIEPPDPSNPELKAGPPSDDVEYLIISETRKGKKILAVSGKVVAFDAEGKARVNKADAEYLKNLPGFDV